MLLVHALGAGYRHYTAEFLQAASLRAGNPITVAGIPVGNVTSMKLDGDHVEAGLKIRDNIALGKDSRAHDQGHHHPRFALPRAGAQRPGVPCPTTPSTWRTPRFPTTCKPPCRTPPPPSSRSTPTGSPNRLRCWASSSRACPRWCPRRWRTSTRCRRSSRYDVTSWAAAAQHRAGDQHAAPPAGQHRQPGQPGPGPAGPIRRAARRFPRDDAVPDQVSSTP